MEARTRFWLLTAMVILTLISIGTLFTDAYTVKEGIQTGSIRCSEVSCVIDDPAVMEIFSSSFMSRIYNVITLLAVGIAGLLIRPFTEEDHNEAMTLVLAIALLFAVMLG